jgi:RHS repeat-associated protein
VNQVAYYLYDPFGNPIFANGPMASTNPYRFSSKEFHASSRLTYFGRRFYDASVQRWPSQEPLGETAGLNLYRFAENDPNDFVDLDGLDTYKQNRELGGNQRRSNLNPVTHTFLFTTNPDGSLKETYSWGNNADTRGWNKDQPEDIKAANDAIASGNANRVGGATLDPFIDKAFNDLKDPKNRHVNMGAVRNCKSEALNLIQRAKNLRDAAETK